MCHNSKFLETSPLEHPYVVVQHVLKSAWVIFRVLFEVRLKNSDFTSKITKSKQWTSACWSEGKRVQAFKVIPHICIAHPYCA